MKDNAPLPTVLIFGGNAKDQNAMGRALAEGFDCLFAHTIDDLRSTMSDHYVQVAICIDPATAVMAQFADWPETMLIAVSDDSEVATMAPQDCVPISASSWTASQLVAATTLASQLFLVKRDNERMSLEMSLGKARPRRQPAPKTHGFEGILCGPGSVMSTVIDSARQYASFDVPILLIGEAGTGKADLARAIHESSLRSDHPFQALDVTGMSEQAIDLALFGRRKPANGAPAVNKTGLVRRADLGTLFVAGIETLSHALQLRLLRLVRDAQFEVGGTSEPELSQARLITATTEDPQKLIASGRLDPALYYALSIAELTLPTLKLRKSDIPLLARAAADQAEHIHGKRTHGFSEAALEFLVAYDWPGNLRELENEVTRMLIQAQDPVLGPDVISRRILIAEPSATDPSETQLLVCDGPLKDRVEAIEARILRETLTRLRWNKSRSAAELGLSRVGLRAKLDRYGITPPQEEEA